MDAQSIQAAALHPGINPLKVIAQSVARELFSRKSPKN